ADGVGGELPESPVKETVGGAGTEFAGRRELEPHALLERQRVLDGFVFGLGQLRAVDFAAREFCTLIEQLARPQQATDMLGMEWRRVVRQHRRQTSLGFPEPRWKARARPDHTLGSSASEGGPPTASPGVRLPAIASNVDGAGNGRRAPPMPG